MSYDQNSNYPIPVYLNQQIVFDLLAVKEDGFSMIRTVKTSENEENTKGKSLQGNVGVNNVFALLGIGLEANKDEAQTQSGKTQSQQEKIHTPNSLFAKLRTILQKEKVIRQDIDINKLKVGDFVEVDVTLTKAPLISILETYLELIKYKSLFGDASSNSSAKKQKLSPDKQLQELLVAISPKNAIPLIDTQDKIQIIISAKIDFFLNQDVSEALDGEFRVLGKVTRLVKEKDETISLLNRTSFSLFSSDVFRTMIDDLNNLGEYALNLPYVQLEINSPAIQIMPIAIFR
ncbi:hypothetical protein G4Y79_04100 [Phototrophicus methaneseepsis]|uniref:Uncharacterized protein n=1 Tax=Phototrophicus methaneseepsis TaxID=2710758 RepID=A0A7S8EAX3_9CHLR|nr:hypothetical protein [Phototrophicus methaneseepsis]QPC83576.1 hypothetical protein G4Y79_04100 [Phototrophicus methaneseepsis]